MRWVLAVSFLLCVSSLSGCIPPPQTDAPLPEGAPCDAAHSLDNLSILPPQEPQAPFVSKLTEANLTDQEMLRELSGHTWSSLPHGAEHAHADKIIDEEVGFRGKVLTYQCNGLKNSDRIKKYHLYSQWNFKKTGSGSGWLILHDGSALRFVFFTDGTASIDGQRFYKHGKSQASVEHHSALQDVQPGKLFKDLTETEWEEPPEYYPTPLAASFSKEGNFSEWLAGDSTKTPRHALSDPLPKPFWSLECTPESRVMGHEYESLGYSLFCPWLKNKTILTPRKHLTLHVGGYFRTYVDKKRLAPAPSLSEAEMYRRLTGSVWVGQPQPTQEFFVIHQTSYDTDFEQLSFDSEKASIVIAGREKISQRWNLRKDCNNGGWLFLEDGGVSRFAIFSDGTISVAGKRWFPWKVVTTDPKDREKLTAIPAGNVYSTLISRKWRDSHLLDEKPHSVSFNVNGRFDDVVDGKSVARKSLWSLDALTTGHQAVVLHDYDGIYATSGITLLDNNTTLRLGDRTLITEEAAASAKQGVIYTTLGNTIARITYPVPIVHDQPTKFTVELTRPASGELDNGLIEPDSVDSLTLIETPLTKKDGSWQLDEKSEERTFNLGCAIKRGQTIPVQFDLVLSKSARKQMVLRVNPKGSYKCRISEKFFYPL